MSLPVHEQITVAIHNRLIDYNRAAEVMRTEMLSDFTPAGKQIIIVQMDPAYNQDYCCAGNPPAQAYTAPYQIVCIMRQRESSDGALDTMLTDFAAGAIVTMTTPQENWHTWGGLAIDTRLTGREKQVLDGYATLNITMEVIYRVDENNPYNQR